MKTMQAVRIHTYGRPEVLKYEEAPLPKPAPGEVLVRVSEARHAHELSQTGHTRGKIVLRVV